MNSHKESRWTKQDQTDVQEGIISFHTAKYEISFKSQHCFNKIAQKCLAQEYRCSSTKMAVNVFGEKTKLELRKELEQIEYIGIAYSASRLTAPPQPYASKDFAIQENIFSFQNVAYNVNWLNWYYQVGRHQRRRDKLSSKILDAQQLWSKKDKLPGFSANNYPNIKKQKSSIH